jgi:hypothetical protein
MYIMGLVIIAIFEFISVDKIVKAFIERFFKSVSRFLLQVLENYFLAPYCWYPDYGNTGCKVFKRGIQN